MLPWIKKETAEAIPNFDQVLIRLLAECDRNMQKLPAHFDQHEKCLAAVCKSMRSFLQDEDAPVFVLVSLHNAITKHLETLWAEAKKGRTWTMAFEISVWKALDSANTALIGAIGHGVQYMNRQEMTSLNGHDAVLFGLGGVVTSIGFLRHCALNPSITYESNNPIPNSPAELQGLENYQETTPEWLVALLDEGLPEGHPRLSVTLRDYRITVFQKVETDSQSA